MSHFWGGDQPVAPTGKGFPRPRGETLTPLVPLSLRAYKGEGEEKTERCTCTLAQVLASSLVPGRKEGVGFRIGGGSGGGWGVVMA